MCDIWQKKVSRIVYDTAIFEWSIQNFLIEKMGANDDKFLVSPPFKHSNINWYLKISWSEEMFLLHLSHECTSTSKGLPDILSCELRFLYTEERWYCKEFKNPVNISDISLGITIKKLKEEKGLAGNSLTVFCELFTVRKLVHDIDVQERIETTAREKEEAQHQNFSTLAKSIGSIMDDSRFSDVTLKVGEDTFQAHKAILASRSRVFDGMFESGMKENQEGMVQMVDMKSSTVKEMLQYIYAGKIEELSMDRAMDYAAADRYDLPELLGWCKDFIVKHISADDVCNVVVLADLHRNEELSTAARRVFKQHSKTIVKSQAWRDLAENHISVYKGFVDSILIAI